MVSTLKHFQSPMVSSRVVCLLQPRSADAFHNSEVGISIRYRMDGSLFNLRRLQAITKVKETVLRDFLFVDDCALNAGSISEMQISMNKFTAACDNLGLTISTRKNEVIHQPAPHTA